MPFCNCNESVKVPSTRVVAIALLISSCDFSSLILSGISSCFITPENDHGQITSFMEKFVKRMNSYAKNGYSTRYMVDYIEKKTGIKLVPDKRWKNNLR